MKKILFILIALVYGHALFAQDMITLKSGEEIKAKVQEIGTDNVKYKKYDNQSGPLYTLMKSDIFIIKYENGDKDVFTAPSAPQPTVTNQTEQTGDDAESNVIKNAYVPLPTLRKKFYEIGLKLDVGMGVPYIFDLNGEYKNEYDFGFMGGGGVFFDIYPVKTGTWLLGTGASYWGHYYLTHADEFTYALSYLNWDLYFGSRDPLKISGTNLYGKIGLRLSFLTDATISADGDKIKAKSLYNPKVLGFITEWGYATKHFDFGVQGFWMFTNIQKPDNLEGGNIMSGIWGISFAFAYRFAF
ncbi:MAG: hypothetical protein LBN98_02895 [Prevotellaceae bacterium]|jgi:hypothetical protein|nr:hypothetical protein [Prevotellaceae bacterium]